MVTCLYSRAVLCLGPQSCPTLCNPMDYILLVSIHGDSPGKLTMSSSRGSSLPRYQTQVSCTAGGFFTSCATREALYSLATLSIFSFSGIWLWHTLVCNYFPFWCVCFVCVTLSFLSLQIYNALPSIKSFGTSFHQIFLLAASLVEQ